jgi:small neutral amino acid transporter SnatA (MarC family)
MEKHSKMTLLNVIAIFLFISFIWTTFFAAAYIWATIKNNDFVLSTLLIGSLSLGIGTGLISTAIIQIVYYAFKYLAAWPS